MSSSNEPIPTIRKLPGSRKRQAFSLLILLGGILILAAAAAELADAKTIEGNAFKIELVKRTVAAVLVELTGAGA